MDMKLEICEIQRRLGVASTAETEDLLSGEQKPAAVALLLRESNVGIELFFIQRALHPDDPWSGHIGFPGGRFDITDASLRHTAEREAMEEVGFDLQQANYLGRLQDIVGANLPVRVSCFVYHLSTLQDVQQSDEVHDSFWVSLGHLIDPERHLTCEVHFGERRLRVAAIDLAMPDKPVLWGITYRLVLQLLELVS